jgi:hypothetical protein
MIMKGVVDVEAIMIGCGSMCKVHGVGFGQLMIG